MERDNFRTLPISGLENYVVTRDGRVINTRTNKDIPSRDINGYKQVSLSSTETGKSKIYAVHRLVAIAFIPNPEGKAVVNHKDGNKTNNIADNLEWMTQAENVAHSLKTNIISHPRIVQQILNGKVIAEFDTVTKAGKAVGLSRHAISKCCVGVNPSAAGYQWRYKNSEHNRVEVDLNVARPIYDYDNYFVFPDGRIYNTMRRAFLKPVRNASNYCYVTLCKNRRKKNYYVQRIVAEHFLSIDGELPVERRIQEKYTLVFWNIVDLQVDHLNKERHNNRVDNLEWVTASENMRRANA